MVHEPCGFLGHAQGAGQFVARNTVLAVCDLPDRQEPGLERNRGILEDRADLDGKLTLRVLFATLEAALLGQVARVRLIADGAGYRTVRPAHLDHVGVAVVRVRESLDGLLKRLWRVHAQRIQQPAVLVKYIVSRETLDVRLLRGVSFTVGKPYYVS